MKNNINDAAQATSKLYAVIYWTLENFFFLFETNSVVNEQWLNREFASSKNKTIEHRTLTNVHAIGRIQRTYNVYNVCTQFVMTDQ